MSHSSFTAAQPESKLILALSDLRKSASRRLPRNRVVIERASPELDGGRFPWKRVARDTLRVEADIFCDVGPTVIDAVVAYRGPDEALVRRRRWLLPTMTVGRATSHLLEIGLWTYTILAWRDLYTWRQVRRQEA
ncbi:MAG: maltotransferase domain-containing protein [Hyphomicrobiales bacterium]